MTTTDAGLLLLVLKELAVSEVILFEFYFLFLTAFLAGLASALAYSYDVLAVASENAGVDFGAVSVVILARVLLPF